MHGQCTAGLAPRLRAELHAEGTDYAATHADAMHAAEQANQKNCDKTGIRQIASRRA
jgi:hypothetical protein